MDGIDVLMPCPFCGVSAVAVVGSFVRCGGCGAVGPYGHNELEAIQRWNERAVRTRPSPIEAVASVKDRTRAEAE